MLNRFPAAAAVAGPALLAALLLAAAAAAAPAGGQDPDAELQQRPRIGLVLGGGGARGGAHIGVLEVLDELRVPVDCIAGTSMGALVGATFASGATAAEIDEAVTAINWAATLGTEGQRELRPLQRKLAGITYSNNIEFRLSRGRLRSDAGLLPTQRVEQLLRQLVGEARGVSAFDDLPIPYRAVATNMATGEMVVLGDGDLTRAMRASMAVPGAFSPVLLDEQVLADGGMTRNLPVDVARMLCADVVIAVALRAPAPEAEELESLFGLAGRSIEAMIRANEQQQLATLGEHDVAILVPVGEIGSAQFERVPETIPLGREAARDASPALARYSLSEADYRQWRASVFRTAPSPVKVSELRFRPLRHASPGYLASRLRTQPGSLVDLAEIEADMSRLFASGDFLRVDYQLLPAADGGQVVEIDAVEKPGGSNFLRFDLGLGASTGGDALFALRADHRREWMNARGGQWRNSLQLGQFSELESALYQPLDVPQRIYLEPALRVRRSLEDVYDDGQRRARYEVIEANARLEGGVNIGNHARLRTGLRWGIAEADVDIGGAELPEFERTREAALVAGAVYDTRDTAFLPTRGTYAQLEYTRASSALGGEVRYDSLEAVAGHSLPWRGNVLLLAGGVGASLSGELPPWRDFQVGGVRSFPAFERGQLRGESYWTASGTWLLKLADIQTLFGQSLYGGFGLHAVRMSERLDDIREGTIYGAALTLGARTPVGPLLLSLGVADNGSAQLHLALGRPISEGSLLDRLH
jgi:NTE family protein